MCITWAEEPVCIAGDIGEGAGCFGFCGSGHSPDRMAARYFSRKIIFVSLWSELIEGLPMVSDGTICTVSVGVLFGC